MKRDLKAIAEQLGITRVALYARARRLGIRSLRNLNEIEFQKILTTKKVGRPVKHFDLQGLPKKEYQRISKQRQLKAKKELALNMVPMIQLGTDE